MKERLQKILSARGVASRRRAEEWILAGRVTCNGQVCGLGATADPDVDEICIDGKPLPDEQEHIYLMLHKPRGFVTTLSDEKGRKNAAQLVSDCEVRVYPIGRLDMDSEGLLLFTNDGEFANHLMHPKHQVDKVYRVIVRGMTDESVKKLSLPVTIDGYRIAQPSVSVIRNPDRQGGIGELQVTIHEGRNRQVRKMCAIAGLEVHRLIRIAEGQIELGDLPKGKWRHLTPDEVMALTR